MLHKLTLQRLKSVRIVNSIVAFCIKKEYFTGLKKQLNVLYKLLEQTKIGQK